MKLRLMFVFPLLAAALLVPRPASAHCDTLDGPVVSAARTALETGKLEPVLAWVQAGDEEEIRHVFTMARAARKTGKEAREVADRLFFETLVRVHRAGEGAPFTGLKPAGMPDPAVAAADLVIAGGSPKQLEEMLVKAVREGLHTHLARLKKESVPAQDVAAGRRWVAAYVPFVHWAEGVYTAAASATEHGAGHGGHAAAPAEHKAGATPKPAKAEASLHDHH